MVMPDVSSSEIAEFLNSKQVGNTVSISGVNSLTSATPDEMAFCVYSASSYILESDAGLVIAPTTIHDELDTTIIESANPRLDFVKIVDKYFSTWPSETQIHPTAVVSDEADVGEQCIIGPNVYIAPCVSVGDRCKIQSGTSIGGEGFGFFPDGTGKLYGQIHQGKVVIEDRVEIGSNCSIDRAVFDKTIIGSGTKMDNLIHVAHNVIIGEDVWIADTAAIQGSVKIGDRVRIHPNSSVADHVTVGDGAEIAMNAAVLEDVPAEDTVAGVPAASIK
jgi:UDP-3-O-[3-hydroxymyristoyl] glucosamine N-acyltransferase